MQYFRASSLPEGGRRETESEEKALTEFAFINDVSDRGIEEDDFHWIEGDAGNGCAVAFLVPYMAGRLHTVKCRLKPGSVQRFRFEVHGFVSRMQKAVAAISREGEVLHDAEEMVSVSVQQVSSDGSLEVTLQFVPFRSANEWFYIFPFADTSDGKGESDISFGWKDVRFSVDASTTERRSAAHLPIQFVEGTAVSCQHMYFFRNSLHLQFEVYRPGTDLVALRVEFPMAIDHCQWWTSKEVPVPRGEAVGGRCIKLEPQLAASPIASPALMDHFGPGFANRGHEFVALFKDYRDLSRLSMQESDAVRDITIHARFSDRTSLAVKPFTLLRASDESLVWWEDVVGYLDKASPCWPGEDNIFLEVGARGERSRSLKTRVPDSWRYIGVDTEKDGNVELVADAHSLSSYLQAQSVAAIYSADVMEHLMSPASFVIEANKVLKTGGLFIAKAPFAWPLHAEPHDYWRFSSHSWVSLLNRHTGFEILDVSELGEASVVPAAPTIDGMTRAQYDLAPMWTCVVARKISESSADWRGWSPDLAFGQYDPALRD
ncbi:methyltransferase domain-containing protein [Parvibaculum sp. MBR-TMA-1.3b-4.2]